MKGEVVLVIQDNGYPVLKYSPELTDDEIGRIIRYWQAVKEVRREKTL